MLNKIIELSLRNKLIVGLATLVLVLYGAFAVSHLAIDAEPDITDNQVQIITTSPSLGAPDVERFITVPIERATRNIQGIQQVRSFSRFGLSVVTIVFKENVNQFLARQQVSERLQEIADEIPKDLGTPTMAPITTGLGEIYQYIVRPKIGFEHRYSTMDLRTIEDWIVRPQLLGIDGVADVASFGGDLKQYEVAVVPSRLKAAGVTMDELFTALEKNNQNAGGAYIEKGPVALFIRTEGLAKNIDDIKNIVVKNLPDGTPLLVRNVADVKLGKAVRYGALTYNGQGEVSGAVVMMIKGGNAKQVIKNVKTRVVQIQKTLPEGVKIEPFLDRTKMVNKSINTVIKNLSEGALIVIFVLVLFLGNLRAGLIVASVIPLSMLFAIILMNLFGVSGNLMSLGALDFGLIVDGAVIIVEAVLHKIHDTKRPGITELSRKDLDGEVKTASERMMNAAVFGQILILIVYLPILALQGIEGKMFKPMAQTVLFALIGAFLLSLTYVPVMSSLFLSRKIKTNENKSDKVVALLVTYYQKALQKVLKISKPVMIGIAALFVLSTFLLTRMGGEFIPELPEGDFAVEMHVLPGSNLTTSAAAVTEAERILLQKFPEVKMVVGKTGSSEIPTDPMPIDATDLMVILKDRKDWTSANNYHDLALKMQKALEENTVGATYSFQYPVAMRFNELMTGARQQVVAKIFGDDLDTLKVYGDKLAAVVRQIKGPTDLFVEPISGMPQIVIDYDRSKLAQFGLNVSDVNTLVNAAFAGKNVGEVFEGERKFDLVVRLEGAEQKRLADVQNLLIPTNNGSEIPLSAVASVQVKEDVNQIQRENARRRIFVGFNVKDRDVESTVADLQKKVDQEIKLPAGYSITYGGDFQNLKEAKQRLGVAVPISLLLILVMLYFSFRSVEYGLIIFTAIPLSIIGGVFGLWVRGMPFSISAGVGFIALFGVSVLNGLVLISEFKRQKTFTSDLKEIVLNGGATRLRPVLMTATVASLGFLPMAVSQGEGAEVQRPLATVVIAGLMVATFLTLFVIPILFIFFEKRFHKKTMIGTDPFQK